MATTNELIDWTWRHLDNNSTLYPADEVVLNGLNPAMRLLCLLQPQRHTSRVLLPLAAQEALIDLRQVAPTAWKPLRLVPGDVRTQTITGGWGDRDLPQASLRQISTRRGWWRHEGHPRQWIWIAPHGLLLHPRPVMASTWTLMSAAVPTALDDAVPDGVPELSAPLHPLIAEIAAALLLCKESGLEMQKALEILNRGLGLELRGMPPGRPRPQPRVQEVAG